MKGFLLAVGFMFLCTVLVTLLFRAGNLRNRATTMVRVFLVTVPLFVAAYALTPASLWVLPPTLVEPWPLVECSFGLFVYAALFFGGLLQAYNLAERGFSLRILIDIEESPGRILSYAELLRGYAAGRGLGWMLDKRMEGLLEHGFVAVEGGRCCNTAKGTRTARFLGALRVFLQLDPAP